jgi:hypothetical protein
MGGPTRKVDLIALAVFTQRKKRPKQLPVNKANGKAQSYLFTVKMDKYSAKIATAMTLAILKGKEFL